MILLSSLSLRISTFLSRCLSLSLSLSFSFFCLVLVLLAQLSYSAAAAAAGSIAEFDFAEFLAPHKPEFSISHVSYAFPSREDSEFYESNQIWKNVLPAGIKYHADSDSLFISTPRWQRNRNPPPRQVGNYTYAFSLSVPASFSKFDRRSGLFHPYPSWDQSFEGAPDAIQSVLGFEIDAYNRLWILDQGRIYWERAREEICAMKLLVYNLTDNSLLRRHCFSGRVAYPETAFLNDIVVDTTNNAAYISDSGIGPNAPPVKQTHGQLIIYNFYDNSARSILRDHYSTQMQSGFEFFVNGSLTRTTTGADGLALTPDSQWLIWCPLTSRVLYAIDVPDLLDLSNEEADFENAMFEVMTKPGASDGLFSTAMQRPWHKDATYTVYEFLFSDLENSAIWRARIPFNENGNSNDINIEAIMKNVHESQWPDTIATDWDRGVYWMANSLSRWSAGELDWTQKNFHIWKANINQQAYLYDMALFTGDAFSPQSDDGGDGPIAPWKYAVSAVMGVILLIGIVFIARKYCHCCTKQTGELDESKLGLLTAAEKINSTDLAESAGKR